MQDRLAVESAFEQRERTELDRLRFLAALGTRARDRDARRSARDAVERDALVHAAELRAGSLFAPRIPHPRIGFQFRPMHLDVQSALARLDRELVRCRRRLAP